MLARILSCSVQGIDGTVVEVEVDVANGMPVFSIVGLPDTAVKESKERIRSAIKSLGAKFPYTRITVNLAPADIKKEGPAYDLPIALGILIASGQLQPLPHAMVVGELGLDGTVRRAPGILPMALEAERKGLSAMFFPADNAGEVSFMEKIRLYPTRSLAQVAEHAAGGTAIARLLPVPYQPQRIAHNASCDLKEIKGQEQAKRALEIAAAGGHNLCMTGPPGSGKTMLARALPSLLPALSFHEALEVTKIYSITGLLEPGQTLLSHRPFRTPHHTTSGIALVGGGKQPKPGEISLAHRGVLFLDEFPEFSTYALESLRQPMQDGLITVTRVQGTCQFPARFMLVAAMNPCPCGYYGDETHPCTCTPHIVRRYHKRLSGPLLDRIDLHCSVPSVPHEKLLSYTEGESSSVVQNRIDTARQKQTKRLEGTGRTANADMIPADMRNFCCLETQEKNFLEKIAGTFSITARGVHRLLKVARTIADLAEHPTITLDHLAEAVQYRPKISM